MSVATKAPLAEPRIRLTRVEWETFERLAATARGGRFAYDRGVLEIVSPGPLHESYGRSMGEFVRVVSRTLRIPRMTLGSTTWKRPEAQRGIEADDCFYFTPEKIAAANAARDRGSNDSVDYPAPDLALEVDISEPEIDRPSIYATIGVDEIWRLADEEVRLDQLGQDGVYTPSQSSRFLPVRAIDIQRWLTQEDRSDEAAWEGRLTAWARRLVRPRAPRRPRPKPGP